MAFRKKRSSTLIIITEIRIQFLNIQRSIIIAFLKIQKQGVKKKRYGLKSLYKKKEKILHFLL